MKTKFLILILLLFGNFLNSCSETDTDILVGTIDTETLRSQSEILTIAEDFIAHIDSHKSRSSESIFNSIVPVFGNNRSRVTSEPLIYAVNLKNNEGFVLVAAPKNVTPVIGYSFNGNYSTIEESELSNFNYYLNKAIDYIDRQRIKDPDSIVITPAFSTDTIIFNLHYRPRIKVAWGQLWPENIYCPNRRGGCEPIALVQIMSYFKQPSTLNLTFDNSPEKTLEIDWDDIIKHTPTFSFDTPNSNTLQNHFEGCEASTKAHYDLAKIVRQIGQIQNSRYDFGSGMDWGTWTTIDSAISASKKLLPNNFKGHFYTTKDLFNHLSGKGIIMFIGAIEPNKYLHAWILDGCFMYSTTVNHYEGGKLVESESLVLERYVYHNWGENGRYNGAYLFDVYDTEAQTYEPPPWSSEDPFVFPKGNSRTSFPYNHQYLLFKK